MVSMIPKRLVDKLKLNCHKNPVQNVVMDWLLNGKYEEKCDACTVINNVEDTLKIVNGLNHQLNPQFNLKDFNKSVNDMLFKLLTTNDDFKNKETRNRQNIETRGWLLTAYATSSNI